MANESLEKLTQRLEEMEKRLNTYEDLEKIKELHGRYLNAHVFGDAEGEAACFTEKGILDIPGAGPLQGKAAIIGFLTGTTMEGPRPANPLTEGGFVVHPEIRINGDKATGKWVNYNFFSYTNTMQILYWVQALFDAEYLKENGEWKISYVKWTARLGPGVKQRNEQANAD